MNIRTMNSGEKKITIAVVAVALIGVTLGFAPHALQAKSAIYADASAKGDMNGSAEKPFDKIQNAIDKAAKEDKNVIVRKGTYVENIVVKEDVEVNGEDQDKVVIIAKDKKNPTVILQDDTEIRKVTIKDGEYGVVVERNAHAVVDKCDIKNNKKDGIKIKESKSTDKKYQFELYHSSIEDNGWNGIYAEERKTVIMDNDIIGNNKEGVELEKGSVTWMEDNNIRDNKRNGLKITIDGSKIFTKDNTYNSNDDSGVEITAKGKTGVVTLEKSKFYNNDDFGIERVNKGGFSAKQWQTSVTVKDPKFSKNADGTISAILNK